MVCDLIFDTYEEYFLKWTKWESNAIMTFLHTNIVKGVSMIRKANFA